MCSVYAQGRRHAVRTSFAFWRNVNDRQNENWRRFIAFRLSFEWVFAVLVASIHSDRNTFWWQRPECRNQMNARSIYGHQSIFDQFGMSKLLSLHCIWCDPNSYKWNANGRMTENGKPYTQTHTRNGSKCSPQTEFPNSHANLINSHVNRILTEYLALFDGAFCATQAICSVWKMELTEICQMLMAARQCLRLPSFTLFSRRMQNHLQLMRNVPASKFASTVIYG